MFKAIHVALCISVISGLSSGSENVKRATKDTNNRAIIVWGRNPVFPFPNDVIEIISSYTIEERHPVVNSQRIITHTTGIKQDGGVAIYHAFPDVYTPPFARIYTCIEDVSAEKPIAKKIKRTVTITPTMETSEALYFLCNAKNYSTHALLGSLTIVGVCLKIWSKLKGIKTS